MYDSFQTWASKTYGDSSKTKTVTRRKYLRILKILKGEEQTNAENSKFRFWVRAKGFTLGAQSSDCQEDKKGDSPLYVPCGRIVSGDSKEKTIYKKVAVVENFFDIIYGVHVESDGRSGKHAGQKRTYRAIAETYAFLPREAVTHFLMSCSNCQKRMHIASDSSPSQHGDAGNHGNEIGSNQNSEGASNTSAESDDIDYTLPITTTYLKHMRDAPANGNMRTDDEDCGSTVDSEASESCNCGTTTFQDYQLDDEDEGDDSVNQNDADSNVPLDMTNQRRINESVETRKRTDDTPNKDDVYQFNGFDEKTPDARDDLSAEARDDDDEEEEEEEKSASKEYDPERLKAFNLFVRLFVDENLDRMIPISRQPKEKVQAIIESCRRQFPEFAERSRKRIRTYLKSCRRTKRSRHQNGTDGIRPTPPHLTSALAEKILAEACDNESLNAKRMRLGLKPIAVMKETKADTDQKSLSNSCKKVTAAHDNSFPINVTNKGPTDLSLKRPISNCINYTLNPNEVFAVKQLIAGYRESAAFLFRSADELEHLLQQQC